MGSGGNVFNTLVANFSRKKLKNHSKNILKIINLRPRLCLGRKELKKATFSITTVTCILRISQIVLWRLRPPRHASRACGVLRRLRGPPQCRFAALPGSRSALFKGIYWIFSLPQRGTSRSRMKIRVQSKSLIYWSFNNIQKIVDSYVAT